MGMFQMLLVAWGVVLAMLVCTLIYRSMLENREDDQLFLDAAGDSMAREQRSIVSRIEKLRWPITALMVVCGLLSVALAGLWFWRGFQRF